MIRPILACENPYDAAEKFVSAGWNLDFSQPPESGDPLVGISLFDNSILLGITDGYVADNKKKYLGCGVEIYLTIPSEKVRAMENFCAVILESPNIKHCYQTGNNRTAQVIPAENGYYGIDISRTSGPEAIWKNKQGMKFAWRKDFEWLIDQIPNSDTNT